MPGKAMHNWVLFKFKKKKKKTASKRSWWVGASVEWKLAVAFSKEIPENDGRDCHEHESYNQAYYERRTPWERWKFLLHICGIWQLSNIFMVNVNQSVSKCTAGIVRTWTVELLDREFQNMRHITLPWKMKQASNSWVWLRWERDSYTKN